MSNAKKMTTIEFKMDDIVVVTIANPTTRIKGIVRSPAVQKEDGLNHLIHWDDGTKQWWRADRLELYNPTA